MSKNDKDLAETESTAELATEPAVAGNGAQQIQETQPLEPESARPKQESSRAEQSRQFNAWLDRALPRLMDHLGNSTTEAVTSSSRKAKH